MSLLPFKDRRFASAPGALLLFVVTLCCTGGLGAGASAQEAAKQAEHDEEGGAVIVPGKEQLLAEMLGQGATLPGKCAFLGGQIERSFVQAKYQCPDGEVTLDLRHVKSASAPLAKTEQFAIAVASGTPPAGLVDEVASLVRSKEAGFEWKWIEPTRKAMPQSSVNLMVVGGGGLLAIALWMLWRRRTTRS